MELDNCKCCFQEGVIHRMLFYCMACNPVIICMQAMAEATANLGPAKQRSVYFFTYSQYDSSQLFTHVDACHSCW